MSSVLRSFVAAAVSGVLGVLVACSSDDATTSMPAVDAGGPDVASSTSSSSGGSTSSSASSSSGSSSGTDAGADAEVDAGPAGPMIVTSPAFAAAGAIPDQHTCEGTNVSPSLAWTGAPASAASFAVVVRDLSLAGSGNYHWVLWDIPANVTSLAEGIAKDAAPAAPAGAKQTYWSFGPSYGWSGPCPPPADAAHQYRFEVLALPMAVAPVAANETSPTAADAVLQANAIARGSVIGTFDR
jgi:Raf kinase inhibitor-like YbhB/YbcL family protein